MKRKLFLLAIFASSLLLASCGGNGSGPRSDAADSREIIGYYNKALEVFRYGYTAEKAGEVFEYMDNKGRALVAPIIIQPNMYRDSAVMTAPGDCFGKAAGDSLTALFREYYAASERIDKNYAAFKAYLKAEDYKDDDWAEGKRLAQQTREAAERIADARGQILGIISGPADEAEMVLMKDNPFKEHVMLSKKIFARMEKVMETVSAEEVDEKALTADYSALEQLVKEGRELPAVKDRESEMRSYNEYLDEVDGFLGEVRKARREGRYTESVLRDMDYRYGKAVSDYNTFAD